MSAEVTRDNDKAHGALLPNGMLDILPESAEAETRVAHLLLETFAKFSYRQVNPPLVEFEDSLLPAGSSDSLANKTFRLMDPISRRMMAIRPDATIQIVRIAASRLKTMPRPLRLSYVADVMRVKASLLRPERQFKQVGCELLGVDTAEASAEAALLAIIALNAIGVKRISIDFTAPEIVRLLAQKVEDAEGFVHACQRRDEDALKKFGESGKMMVRLNRASGPVDEFFKQIQTAKLPDSIKASFVKLKAVMEELRAGMKAYGLEDQVTMTVDPLESKGFEYETSPSFTLFAHGIRGELGRGGYYEASFRLNEKQNHKEPANGFTLYMDSMLRAIAELEILPRLFVPAGTAWSEIKKYQDDGYAVIRGTSAKMSPKDLAAMDCTHIYKNGKIQLL